MSIEEKLNEAGVFKGHHGLRGLLEASEFWDDQPYCTRLYYGDGIADYLHRGVLKAACEILDGLDCDETPQNKKALDISE